MQFLSCESIVKRESHMVNFKKISAFITVIGLFFLTPMTLRAETNIGVNPEQVAPPPKEGPNVLVSLQLQLMRKLEIFCMIKTHITVHFRLV